MPCRRRNKAEKEETRRIRQELDAFKQEVQEIDSKEADDKIARKIAQIQQRKERHAKRQAEKKENQEKAAAALRNAQNKTQADSKRDIQIGDTVRIKGLTTIQTDTTTRTALTTKKWFTATLPLSMIS